jgi:hypothetical protein
MKNKNVGVIKNENNQKIEKLEKNLKSEKHLLNKDVGLKRPISSKLETNKSVVTNPQSKINLIKTEKNLNTSNFKENISTVNNLISSTSQSSLPVDNIENLISIHNSLEFLNLQLMNTFEKQKCSTDKLLQEKVNDLIKLREYNFNLTSKLNNLMNIQQVESYLNVNYNKIVSCSPKVDNILENLEDLKININYGLDRLYLEDNLVCDEKELTNNIDISTKSMQNLAEENSDNLVLIQEIKNKYSVYFEQLQNQKKKIEILNSLLTKFKKNSLDEKIDEITIFLKRNNNKIEDDLFV